MGNLPVKSVRGLHKPLFFFRRPEKPGRESKALRPEGRGFAGYSPFKKRVYSAAHKIPAWRLTFLIPALPLKLRRGYALIHCGGCRRP